MSRRDVDRAIAQLSRQQYGAFNRAQVLAAGGSPDLITRRLRSGAWVRLAPGVYAIPGVDPSWKRQVMAATLVHDGLVAAAGSTAGVLLGADGFRQGGPRLLIAHGMRRTNPLATVRRSRHLLGSDITRVGGIPTLNVERLVVDLAPTTDRHELGRLIDRAVILNKFDPDRLLERAAAILRPGRKEAILVTELLAERWTGTPPASSELEACLYELLDAAGYRNYRRQAVPPWFERARGGVVVDTLFDDDRVILEGDGRLWHARLEQWERDLRRDGNALARGYITVRVTWRMLQEVPEAVVASLAPWVRRAGKGFSGRDRERIPRPNAPRGPGEGPGGTCSSSSGRDR